MTTQGSTGATARRGYRGPDRRRAVPHGGPPSHAVLCLAGAATLLAVLAPRVLAGTDPEVVTSTREVLRLLGTALLVTAAALRYVRWRLTGEARSGLLAALLAGDVLVTVPLAQLAGLLHPQLPAQVAAAPARLVAVVLCSLTALRLVRLPVVASRLRPGAVVGGFVLVSSAGWLLPVLSRLTPETAVAAAHGLEVVAALVLAAAALLVVADPRAGSARTGLPVLLALLGGAEAARALSFTAGPAWGVSAALLLLGAGVVALAEASPDLRSALAFSDERVVGLAHTLAARLHERDQLRHDARSAIAALQAALHALHVQGDGLDAATRAELASAVTSEVGRLGHLIAPPATPSPGPFALAPVVESVVTTMASTGLAIRWAGSPARALGDRHALATALHAVLVNAQRHGGGGPVDVWVHDRGSTVELHVGDRGPGVQAGARPGVPSGVPAARPAADDGPAGGLGLPGARAALSALGGGVRLRERDGGGAVAVLWLPAAADPRSLPQQAAPTSQVVR